MILQARENFLSFPSFLFGSSAEESVVILYMVIYIEFIYVYIVYRFMLDM